MAAVWGWDAAGTLTITIDDAVTGDTYDLWADGGTYFDSTSATAVGASLTVILSGLTIPGTPFTFSAYLQHDPVLSSQSIAYGTIFKTDVVDTEFSFGASWAFTNLGAGTVQVVADFDTPIDGTYHLDSLPNPGAATSGAFTAAGSPGSLTTTFLDPTNSPNAFRVWTDGSPDGYGIVAIRLRRFNTFDAGFLGNPELTPDGSTVYDPPYGAGSPPVVLASMFQLALTDGPLIVSPTWTDIG